MIFNRGKGCVDSSFCYCVPKYPKRVIAIYATKPRKYYVDFQRAANGPSTVASNALPEATLTGAAVVPYKSFTTLLRQFELDGVVGRWWWFIAKLHESIEHKISRGKCNASRYNTQYPL